jgi:hypothetical protein
MFRNTLRSLVWSEDSPDMAVLCFVVYLTVLLASALYCVHLVLDGSQVAVTTAHWRTDVCVLFTQRQLSRQVFL